MNLTALDLARVVALDALLRAKSVSGAARRLEAKQPAVSCARGEPETGPGDA